MAISKSNADTERKVPVKLLAGLGVGLLVLLVVYWPFGGGKPKDNHPPCYPTKGTLTYNGKPAKGAVVTFWPLPLEKNDWKTVKPQAIVEADGSYQPNSYDLKDGAMPGEYAVTVLWTGETDDPRNPDLLAGRCADPSRPVLKVSIKEQANEIPPIRLTGPAINPKARGVLAE